MRAAPFYPISGREKKVKKLWEADFLEISQKFFHLRAKDELENQQTQTQKNTTKKNLT